MARRALRYVSSHNTRRAADHLFVKKYLVVLVQVHERSVDTDVLCLLTRRLVERHPHLRVVLMSATLCADLYRDYFNIPAPHIFVGARRFPVTEAFADDVARQLRLPPRLRMAAEQLAEETRTGRPPSQQAVKLQVTRGSHPPPRHRLTSHAVLVVAGGGGGDVASGCRSILPVTVSPPTQY